MKTSTSFSRRGAALVLTLCIVVLLTFVVVALLSRARQGTSSQQASVAGEEADSIGRSAGSLILSDLQEEIRANSSTHLNGYRPATPADLRLQRTLATPAMEAAGSGFELLVRQSLPGTQFSTGGAPLIQGATTVSTSLASPNGRVVTPTRWDFPQLLRLTSGGTNTSFTAADAPHWILLTRNGPAADGSFGATGNTLNNPVSTNPNFVIGRFAFNVYDTGGLIDLNQMGSAIAASTMAGDAAPFKGSPLHASIDSLAGANTPNAMTFGQWKHGVGTAARWQEIVEHWQRTGGLSPANGNRAFVTRQDLLAAANSGNTGIGSGTDLFPHVTHFSRVKNAPSLPYIDPSKLDFSGTDSRFSAVYPADQADANGIIALKRYKDNGTLYDVAVKAGDPVLQSRFSLGKISWLTPEGPFTSTFPGVDPAAAIKACFGLEWHDAEERWIYTSPDSSTPADKIKTLDEVAAEGRAPDFFETLKAGINPDSLGGRQIQSGANLRTTAEDARQQSEDLQILRIGASIVDCGDADNYPTRILFDQAGDIEVAGVEDLPYLFGAMPRFYYTRTESPPTYQFTNMQFWLAPVLFNPHRSGNTATEGPTSLFVDLKGGKIAEMKGYGPSNVYISAFDSDSYPLGTFPRNMASASTPPLLIASAELEKFRNVPRTLDGQRDKSTSNAFNVLDLADLGITPFTVTSGANPPNVRPTWRLTELALCLTYDSPKGTQRVYDTLAGGWPQSWSADVGWGGFGWGLSSGSGDFTTPARLDGTYAAAYFKPDARTTRYGMFYSTGLTSESSAIVLDDRDGDTKRGDFTLRAGLGGSANYRIDAADLWAFPGSPIGGEPFNLVPSRWPLGGPNAGGTNLTNVADRPQDPQPVFRPNDAFFGAAGNPLDPVTAPTGASAPSSATRPVILQRPYRNVAELGYVFRDQPWKSLGFFHGTSADAALLDLFCVSDLQNEPPAVAGLVNLNSPVSTTANQALRSLVRDAGLSLSANPATHADMPSPTQADNVADAVASSLASADPLEHPAQIITEFLSSTASPNTLDSAITANFQPTKGRREAYVRALSGGTTQTRTWNVLIDIIAQSGLYSPAATSLNQFVVRGERRYWLHAAIDRYTGEIVALQWEPVFE